MSLGNVLIIRPGALGDAVLTLPVLTALIRANSGSVTLLGTPANWAFFDINKSPFTIVDFASNAWLGLFADGASLSNPATETLRNTHTAIIYLSGDTSGIQLRLLKLGVSKIVVSEPPIATPFVMTSTEPCCFDFKWNTIQEVHAARRLLDPLAHCGVDLKQLFRSLDPAFEIDGLHPHSISKSPSFAVHPGSGGRKKCWEAKRFAELTAHSARQFKLRPIVFFGPADETLRAQFSSAMPGDVEWDAIENRPLREVFPLLHSCRCFVGNDSGLSHLAARAIPVLSIFGPSDPSIWGAIGQRVRIVQAARGDLTTLDVETVFNALIPLFQEPGKLPQL